MKVYRRVLFISTALILTGIFLFMKMTFSYRGSSADTLMINDIVSSVRESWDSMDSFDGSRFGTEMIVFDSQDFIVYSDAGEELEGVTGAEADVLHLVHLAHAAFAKRAHDFIRTESHGDIIP